MKHLRIHARAQHPQGFKKQQCLKNNLYATQMLESRIFYNLQIQLNGGMCPRFKSLRQNTLKLRNRACFIIIISLEIDIHALEKIPFSLRQSSKKRNSTKFPEVYYYYIIFIISIDIIYIIFRKTEKIVHTTAKTFKARIPKIANIHHEIGIPGVDINKNWSKNQLILINKNSYLCFLRYCISCVIVK